MFRTTLLLITLCALVACDAPSRTTSPVSTVTDNQPPRLAIHGILRRVVDDPTTANWVLEAGGGEMYRLLGGPVERYESLVDKDVFVVGIVQSNTIMVDTCDEDTRIIADFNRRAGGGK